MSLGDFFTLTEMKDGLSTLLRVEELVASMQKEKDCSLNLVGDGTRQQWSAVVETLAATENKDCLNHFVQLNGLCFLNQWLQEYQKCDMDAAEGLIDSLLATLEKLPHDREKLILSGIGITVENLINHRSLTIKEKAKNLSDKWNDTGTNDASCHDLGDPDTSQNDQPKPPLADANVRTDDANYEVETTGVEDVKLSVSDQPMPTTTGGDAGVGGDVNSVGSSRISNSCPDSVYKAVPDGTEEMEVEVAGTEQGSSPCKSSRKESGDASSSSSSSSSDLSASSPSSSVGDTKGSQGEPISSPIAEETKTIESGLGLEYEEIDALEMARQVALEVEREVVNSREPFCSSPEVNSGETEDKQDQPLIQDLDSNTLPIEKDHPSDDASSPEHKQSVNSPKKGPVFDLNEAVCTEEFDCSMQPAPITPTNLSAPKAVVATSRGAPNLPATPLQFEGEMGWKGSAATSAFRPASPRRTPGPKEKKNFLDFDLNDVAVDPVLMKQTPPVSCGLPSGDSSVEVSSRRAERLKLDLNLNRLGDEDVSMNNTPYPYWRIHHQNGDQSVSSASSSSPRQQPSSMRDFDLNDNPSFFDKSSSKASTMTYASPKDPVVTIMESRMGGVERKDYLSQAHQPFLGNMEAMMSARPMMPYYSHMPPPYGYSGHPGGHVPTMPIHPSFYGHGAIPYMVEAPQVLGPTGVNGAYYGRPPFLTSVAGAPVNMNGLVRPPWSGLDLNSCMSPIDNSGPRDGGSFKQPMFMHGHNGLMEEQQRISSQPAAGSGKRKEPECGWEPYPVGFKHVTSWL